MEDDPKPIPSETSSLSAFWRELRRRKVVRVAVVYAVVAWLLIQVSATVFPQVGLPDWTSVFVTWILIIGFPVALIIAWAFDVTPEGVKAGSEDHIGGSIASAKGNRLNYVTLGLVVLVLTFLVVDRYMFDAQPATIENGNTPSEGIPITRGVKRSVISLPKGDRLELSNRAPLGVERRSLALSPNGEHLVYVVDLGTTTQLFLQAMDQFEAQALEGTEGAFGPFFSPDGEWIAYHTNSKILKVSIRGGSPQSLTDAGNVYGGTWGPDNNIVFAENEGSDLSMVSADGGKKQVLVKGAFTTPSFLPNRKGILLTQSISYPPRVLLYHPEKNEIIPIIERGASACYVPTGHIVYTSDSGISAVPFDITTMSITGSAMPILDDVRIGKPGLAQLSFSDDGLLAYIPGDDMELGTPVWVDRNGIEEPIPLPPQRYSNFRLSPDNSRISFLIQGPTTDLWLYDFRSASLPRKLTVLGNIISPIWDHHGRSLTFGIFDPLAPEGGIFRQSINSNQVEPIIEVTRGRRVPDSWVNEETLVYTNQSDLSTSAVQSIQISDSGDSLPILIDSSGAWGASMSPDGKFVTYTSDESGEYQIYVKRYPPTEVRWTISEGYGEEPIWSAKGDEIFYRRGQEFLSVSVQTEPEFKAGAPEVIFAGPYLNSSFLSYDVTQDGQRFLLQKQPDQPEPSKIHLVANWFEELEALVPTDQ